jgi:hypothetical protein
MPIALSELVLYGPANHPQNDTDVSGGAIDTAKQPDDFNGIGGGDQIALVSNGTDSRVVTLKGRSVTGTIITENVQLASTAEVLSTNVFDRLLTITTTLSTTRTITVRLGPSGSTITTIPPNITFAGVNFIDSASEPAAVSRYEKVFWRNNNASLSLLNAQVTLTEDPRARIRIALATAKSDTGSVTNRRTSPGLTFSDDGVALGVPGGFLGPGEAIGVWIEQTLPANDGPHTPVGVTPAQYTLRLSGQTV